MHEKYACLRNQVIILLMLNLTIICIVYLKTKATLIFFKDLDASKTCISKVTSIGLMINNKIRFDKLKAATHFNTFSIIVGKLVRLSDIKDSLYRCRRKPDKNMFFFLLIIFV